MLEHDAAPDETEEPEEAEVISSLPALNAPSMPKKPGPGRKAKLTPEMRDRIATAIRAGVYVETAAAMTGIHKDTFYYWLKRGAAGRDQGVVNLYTEFSDAIEKATAEGEARLVGMVSKAASNQWQAAAWMLERKSPARWGRRDSLQHQGEVQVRVVRAEALIPLHQQRLTEEADYEIDDSDSDNSGGDGDDGTRN